MKYLGRNSSLANFYLFYYNLIINITIYIKIFYYKIILLKRKVIKMNIRTVQESDYTEVITVIDAWWGGRHMSDMLPRLFFKHFQNTSFIAEENDKIIGFLIGFISQSYPTEAYIHFIGVHPEYRKSGIAKELYELFFNAANKLGCTTVHSVTSPINKGSIAFHKKMGFEVEKGDNEIDGISVTTNYDGNGGNRVLFIKKLLD